ncbi:MAG: glycosyltransferase [Candidatus Magasanikbacteria bacterium]|nr:glycosyltransferase [Candidatus Magasanikbacteria bacterium]
MTTPKKILFVSCSAGAGHKRAAEALRLTCAKIYPDIEARHIDLIDYSNGLVKKTASSYHFLAKHLPDVYGLLYDGSDSTIAAKFLNYFSSIFQINTKKLRRFVKQYNPDRIICTHFLASPFLKSFAETTPLDMLITDYELNKVVLDPKIRYFFAPEKGIADEISALGRQAYATGIPIHPQFFEQKNFNQTLNDFGLNIDIPTVLVMSGGTGLADTTSLVKKVLKNQQKMNLLVISGKNNRQLYGKLSRLTAPSNINYKIVDFTERIDELMKTADLIITKPGGLTITECMHLAKPLLLVSPIPGQEEANIRFLEKNNYGRLVADHNEITNLIDLVLNGTLKFTSPVLPVNAAETILQLSFTD